MSRKYYIWDPGQIEDGKILARMPSGARAALAAYATGLASCIICGSCSENKQDIPWLYGLTDKTGGIVVVVCCHCAVGDNDFVGILETALSEMREARV